MTAPYNRMMHRDATYWAPLPSSDGFGRAEFGEPTPVKVRWENKTGLFKNREGREITSSAVVYVNQAVQTGGYIARGLYDFVDPREALDSREIGAIGESDNLNGTLTIHKALLK